MIMCHLRYREMGANDFPSWDEWVRAVNDNQRYCKSLGKHRVAEYRFKCRPSNLPSFHPYWRRQVHLDVMQSGQRHIRNLQAIRKTPSLVKHLYNQDTHIKDVERMVRAIPKRRQDW